MLCMLCMLRMHLDSNPDSQQFKRIGKLVDNVVSSDKQTKQDEVDTREVMLQERDREVQGMRKVCTCECVCESEPSCPHAHVALVNAKEHNNADV